jgi:pyruvate/2-oxoglutarate/acetoin dehydrogenase E1 component
LKVSSMRRLTIAEALREALREEMLRDASVFLIGEDIGINDGWGGPFGVTKGLAEEFGHERVRDTPISESAIMGVAVGAAMMGMRPVAEVQYGDFMFCAMDQVVNEAAKMRYMSGGQVKVPMVVRVPTGASKRAAQHSQSVEAFFTHVPGLKAVAPCTPYDAKGLLKAAIRDDNPVIFLEHKLLYGAIRPGYKPDAGAPPQVSGEVPEEEYVIPLGQGDIKREGADVTVVAKLLMVHKVLSVASKLADEGIGIEVIDPRTLVPFDKKLVVESVKKTGRLVVVEEDNKTGGWGAEIAAIVSEEALDYLEVPIRRVSAFDTPIPFAPSLEDFVIPNEDRITEAIREIARAQY